MAESGNSMHGRQGQTHPVAVLHQGVFAHANAAFLELFGFSSLEDLQAYPFLDLVPVEKRDNVCRSLSNTTNPSVDDGPSQTSVWQWMTLTRVDGSRLRTFAQIQTCRFNGEDCVQVELRRRAWFAFARRQAFSNWLRCLTALVAILFAFSPILLFDRFSVSTVSNTHLSANHSAIGANLIGETDKTLRLTFKSVALFSEDFLLALDGMASQVRRLPGVDRVATLTTSERISSHDLGLEVVPIIDVSNLTQLHGSTLKDSIRSNDFLPPLLADKDGSSLSLLVTPAPGLEATELATLYGDIINAAENFGLARNLEEIGGPWANDVANYHAIRTDFFQRFGFTVGAELLLFWLVYRRWFVVTLTGIALGVVIYLGLALHLLFGQPYTAVSAMALSAATIFAGVTLGSAFTPLDAQSDQNDATIPVNQGARRPTLYATTLLIASLIPMMFIALPVVRLSALLTIASAVFGLSLTLALLSRSSARFRSISFPQTTPAMIAADRIVQKLGDRAISSPIANISLAFALLVCAVGYVKLAPTQVSLESNLHNHKNDLVTLEVALRSSGKDQLSPLELLKTINALQDWLESQPEIADSRSPVDFIKEMNWAFNGENPAVQVIPNSFDFIQHLLLLYKGKELWQYANQDFTVNRLEIDALVTNTDALVRLTQKIRHQLQAIDTPGLSWQLAGTGLNQVHAHEILKNNLPLALGAGLLLVGGTLALLWRSIMCAFLCALPTLFSLMSLQIATAAFQIKLDASIVWAFAVTMGFSLGRTAFLLAAMIDPKATCRRRFVPANPLSYSYAGRTVTLTTSVACLLFLISLVSDLPGLTIFGPLTALGLISGWLADMHLLPSVTSLLERRGEFTFMRKLKSG